MRSVAQGGGIYLGTKLRMRSGLLAADSLWLSKTSSLKMITFTLTYPGKPMAASFPKKDCKIYG